MLARRALDALGARAGRESLILAAPAAIASILEPDYPGAGWLPVEGRGLAGARRLGLAFRQAKIDRLVLFPSSLSSRITALYSGARERIGHGPRDWDLEALVGLTQRVSSGRRGARHLEEEYLDLARAAGGETGAARRLRVAPEAKAKAEDLLSNLGDFLALAPGARYGPAKRWAPDRFAQVARAWKRGPVVLVGQAADAPATSAVASLLHGAVVDLTAKTDLPTLAAVLERAALVVSNDSGAAHVAAALARPTIIIFGSTDPRWTAPRGDHVTWIWDRVHCAPCFRKECPYEDAYACLRIVESDRVIAMLPH